MVMGIIAAVIIVGGLGLLIGIFLGFAGEKFAVETDERIDKVRACLPGNNCGGCGFAGCDNLAEAIVSGKAPVNGCPVGGEEVGKKVAAIMGEEMKESVRMRAFVACSGCSDNATTDYTYTGEQDCAMMSFVPNGGPKSCNFGCLGYGNCVKACQFDAIHVVNGVSIVDKDKCKACGKCVAACPKHLISLIPYDATTAVVCSSKWKGKDAMKVCKVSCIGCKKCEKTCEAGAVTVTDNLAVIDQDKCTHCGKCIEECPRKAIHAL